MLTIDTLCYHSRLRYMNAGEKCLFTLASIILCIAGRSLPAAAAALLVSSWLTIRKGGVRPGLYLRLLAVPLGFLILGTLALLVNISRTPLDAFAVPAGSFYLTGSKEGLLKAGRLIMTSLSSVSCLYFLSFNTPVTDILAVMEACRVPRLITELMLLMYRFIFLLLETASAMILSQDSRLGNRDLRTALRSRGAMISMLFIRAMRQASGLYDAMESRCYDGRILVLKESRPPRAREILLILAFELILILLILGGKL